jgi:membrane protein
MLPGGLIVRRAAELVRLAVSGWMDDYAASMGAALAYYAMFSMAPLLVISIAVAALVFGHEAAQTEIMEQLRGLVGPEGAQAAQSMLASAQAPKSGVIATVLSAIMLLIGATTVFGEIESDLNRVWKAPVRTKTGIWGLLRSRVLSLGLVVSVGFVLLVSLIVSAGLAAFGKYWAPWFGGIEVLLQIANFVLSIAIFTVLFGLMYKVLPRKPIAWRDVWIGAGITALLFSLGKFLIGLYIGRSAIASAYGAAGAVLVLLIWAYYSAQIFLLGAEFTRAYAERYGSWTDARAEGNRQHWPLASG